EHPGPKVLREHPGHQEPTERQAQRELPGLKGHPEPQARRQQQGRSAHQEPRGRTVQRAHQEPRGRTVHQAHQEPRERKVPLTPPVQKTSPGRPGRHWEMPELRVKQERQALPERPGRRHRST
ncbi:MAG: hypothetical protein ACTIL2_04710, partial [Corynebacterium sp.]|uniref:hypothetical protein n=1 Tax=Corynebacterium sp. TaxID=1720 RepID=UPI003F96A74E